MPGDFVDHQLNLLPISISAVNCQFSGCLPNNMAAIRHQQSDSFRFQANLKFNDSCLRADELLSNQLGLFLNFHKGILHNGTLSISDASIIGSRPKRAKSGDKQSDLNSKVGPLELIGFALFSIALCIVCIWKLGDYANSSEWWWLLLILGCICLGSSVFLLLARF